MWVVLLAGVARAILWRAGFSDLRESVD
eukprot:COSAG06_NODE_74186_length_146_cov_39.170213_1_plen_27_part_01